MPVTPDAGPATALTILAFDYGRRRIGVAVGQAITSSASPVGTARNGDEGPDWARIERWIREWQPQALVVGMPYHADGTVACSTCHQPARPDTARGHRCCCRGHDC